MMIIRLNNAAMPPANIKKAAETQKNKQIFQNEQNPVQIPTAMRTSIYSMSFHGFWGQKKLQTPVKDAAQTVNSANEQIQLNANDEILSLKLADVLHRLDNKSLIVLGSSNASLFIQTVLRCQLTEENSFLPSPKNIENIYFINEDCVDPLIFAKGANNELIFYGKAENITQKPHRKFSPYRHNPVNYGDILQRENGTRIRIRKTPHESNKILYDAKISAQKFINSEKPLLKGISAQKEEEFTDNNEKIKQNKQIQHRTFDDIAGMDEIIEIAKRKILYPMIYPEAFSENKNIGTILSGPPGTGKTLLALAIIGEAKKRKDKDIYCLKIDGSELSRSYVGKTEEKWRKVFKELKNNQPALLFVDEIDSVLGKRENGENFVHNNGVVAQFLTLTDNLEKNHDQIWIIGATNRPENLDPAITRNGRFGNTIEVPPPDEKGCLDILNLYLKDKNVNNRFNRKRFAQKLHQKSATGADIAAIVEKAKENLYDRTGIFKKMDKGTFQMSDIENLEYQECDFVI